MMTSDSGRTMIILSPHLDDAVFSVGGLIARNTLAVRVTTFFAGIPSAPLRSWWDRLCGFRDSTSAITARRAENQAALGMLGVADSHIENRELLDIGYRQAMGTYSASDNARIEASLASEIGRLAAGDQPIDIYVPMQRLHPDHGIVSRAAIAAWKRCSNPNAVLYLYQDFPYTYFFQLRRRFMRGQRRFVPQDILSDPSISLERISVPFDQSTLDQKFDAVLQYKTQFVGFRMLFLWMLGRLSALQRAAGDAAPYREIVYRISRRS